jgi:hypothetical protein
LNSVIAARIGCEVSSSTFESEPTATYIFDPSRLKITLRVACPPRGSVVIEPARRRLGLAGPVVEADDRVGVADVEMVAAKRETERTIEAVVERPALVRPAVTVRVAEHVDLEPDISATKTSPFGATIMFRTSLKPLAHCAM